MQKIFVDNTEIPLLKRAIDGDSNAFGELYMLHLDPIYRYIYFRINDTNDAEDLTEQTFLKAWQALPDYRDIGNPFSCWLYRIAHNLVIDYWRSKKIDLIDRSVHPGEWPEIESNLLKRVIEAEEAGALARAISRLTADQQQVILLRFVEGYNHAEIARILEKSEGACRMLQNRALIALNQILQGMQG
ncbi:MAG TPA: sigma-70 family RNA polymerase sigma factor [Anaerolineaceae bacterium]|nr:sigma-70 family RNA polymerase sigma factor [Anaerolineaceae bacterium]